VKILVSWLRDLVEVPVPVQGLADALSSCGFEVASVEPAPFASDLAADAVIDLEITANRPDCLSVIGIAREVATAFDLQRRRVTTRPLEAAGDGSPLRVAIEDPDRCPRYAAALADVTIGPSPAWLARRIEAAGLRPINNIVDITNYVMVELGQPLHAFDFERLAGPELRVRTARPGERLRTLDGVDRALEPDMLVIADAERPVAIAGVMGGSDSEVAPATRIVAFESAYFQPQSVRRTSKRLGLSTEASYRFERGANIEMPPFALARVAELVEATGAGRMRPGLVDVYPAPRRPLRVVIRHDRIARLLGHAVDAVDVERVLARLGFGLERLDAPALAWQATVPLWRVDISREADLIEEVARHHGYDRLPMTFPAMVRPPGRPDPRIERERAARRVALAAGFSEAVTFTFIERSAALAFAGEHEVVALANPLSEKFAVLRPCVLASLVDSVAHNRRRERRDVRLFEVGGMMTATRGETRGIGLAWTGSAGDDHWSGGARPVDFYDMKGVVEAIGAALGVAFTFEPIDLAPFVSGRAARVTAAGGTRTARDGAAAARGAETAPGVHAGVVGELDPRVAEARGLPPHDAVYLAEIDLDAVASLVDLGEDVVVRPLPRFPSIVRDLSVVVPAATPAAAMRATIAAAAPPTLERVREFARYEGRGVPEGHVSLSFRLTFRAPDRTLTDAEVQEAVDAVLAALAAQHGARLR
jgi:phenylalanyl-tRNA synthetase beta chain